VAKLGNDGFDPKAFLAKVGAGKTILKLAKNKHVFEQGGVADTVFYIQKGRVKLTVLSEQGKYLLTRNSRVEEDLIDQLFNSSEKRLARLLLVLAHFGKEGIPQPLLLDISQETLAEMIGTTRSRVSYFMNKFRKLGLISYNGKIEVHNSLLNAVLHEKPEIERDDSTSKV
jgi:CRP-like cAMP-binding protein